MSGDARAVDAVRPPSRVLLIEDDPGDRELVRRALGHVPLPVEVTDITDGATALDFLADPGGAPRPDLILLDLNLPGARGEQILAAARKTLIGTPIVVWTTSDRPVDLERCERMGCSAYLVKPDNAWGFMEAIRRVCIEWTRPARSAESTAEGGGSQ